MSNARFSVSFMIQPYGGILPNSSLSLKYSEKRIPPRFDVNCKGRALMTGNDPIIPASVENVSSGGFRAHLAKPVPLGAELGFRIRIGDFDIAELTAKPIWTDGAQTYGMKIVTASKNWPRYIAHMEHCHNNPEYRRREVEG